MKISVIIPTYKPQGYLWECLDSLVAQTFPKEDFEVILVLNGCKEPYYSQISEYIDKHSDLSVLFIQTDKGGVSNARNIALEVARGEYVTFIDDDDYVSPKYLEELYSKSSPDTIGLCCPYAFNEGQRSVELPYYLKDVYEANSKFGVQLYPRSRKYFSGPCMKLIPMSFIQGRRFDERFKNGEDSLFMFLISDKFQYVNYTSKDAKYYRRYRPGTAVTTRQPLKVVVNNVMKLMLTYCKYYFSSPLRYNFFFFLSRVLGTIKGGLFLLKSK